MKKNLLDLTVIEMDNSKFVTDNKLYRFSREGVTLSNLPFGSLIFTGVFSVKYGGFYHGEFVVWEGEDIIKNRKWITVKGSNIGDVKCRI